MIKHQNFQNIVWFVIRLVQLTTKIFILYLSTKTKFSKIVRIYKHPILRLFNFHFFISENFINDLYHKIHILSGHINIRDKLVLFLMFKTMLGSLFINAKI